MNPFLYSSKRLINRHGTDISYLSITTGEYDVETGTTTNTETTFTVKAYPRHIVANQYKFPDMIGKELITFYIANDNLGFSIKNGDCITYKSATYKIINWQEHVAESDVVLFRATAVRS